jgi:hypothetical protein
LVFRWPRLPYGIPRAWLKRRACPSRKRSNPSTPDNNAEADGPDIVVTGSRLARDPNAVAPSPINTVTARRHPEHRQSDVTEVLREVPSLISSEPSRIRLNEVQAASVRRL